MTNKVSVNTISSDYLKSSVLNENFSNIQTAIDNTLSLDGTTPNSMSASLDMNSQQIINLPYPSSNLSPLRLGDITGAISESTTVTITGAQLPTGGDSGQVLTKASGTDYDVEWADSSGGSGGGGGLLCLGIDVPAASKFTSTLNGGSDADATFTVTRDTTFGLSFTGNCSGVSSALDADQCIVALGIPNSYSTWTCVWYCGLPLNYHTYGQYYGVFLTDESSYGFWGAYIYPDSMYGYATQAVTSSLTSLWDTSYSGAQWYGGVGPYFKLTFDGTDYKFYCSPNGNHWAYNGYMSDSGNTAAQSDLFSGTVTSYIYLGCMCYMVYTSYSEDWYWDVPYFSLTEGVS